MNKWFLFMISLLLVVSVSYAQYGMEFMENNAYWFMTIALVVTTYYVVFNTFTTMGKQREAIAKPAGLFAAVAVGFAFYAYKSVIEALIGPYVLTLLVLGGIILFLMIVKKDAFKFDKLNLCNIGLVLAAIGLVLAFVGVGIGMAFLFLGVLTSLLCLSRKNGGGGKGGGGGRDDPPLPPGKKYKLTVTVKEDETLGLPLKNAKVTFAGSRGVTDKSGVVVFKSIPEGTHDLKVEDPRGKSRPHEQAVPLYKDERIVVIFKGIPPKRYKVTVKVTRKAGGKDLGVTEGALVNLGGKVEKTDENGLAIFNGVLLGDYKLSSTYGKECTTYNEMHKIEKDEVILIELTCNEPSFNVKFIVKNQKGDTLKDAEITFGKNVKKSTDKDGEAVFKAKYGKYNWVVTRTGCKQKEGVVEVSGDTTVPVELDCADTEKVDVIITVKKKSDETLIKGATVELYEDVEITGEDGKVRFRNIPKGKMKVGVTKKGCKDKTKEHDIQNNPHEITILLDCKDGGNGGNGGKDKDICKILNSFYKGYDQYFGKRRTLVIRNIRAIALRETITGQHESIYNTAYFEHRTPSTPTKKSVKALYNKTLRQLIIDASSRDFEKGTTFKDYAKLIRNMGFTVFIHSLDEGIDTRKEGLRKDYLLKLDKKFPGYSHDDYYLVLLPKTESAKKSYEAAENILKTSFKQHPCRKEMEIAQKVYRKTLQKNTKKYMREIERVIKRIGKVEKPKKEKKPKVEKPKKEKKPKK